MRKLVLAFLAILPVVTPAQAGQKLVIVLPDSYRLNHTYNDFLREFVIPTGCTPSGQGVVSIAPDGKSFQVEVPVSCPKV